MNTARILETDKRNLVFVFQSLVNINLASQLFFILITGGDLSGGCITVSYRLN